MSCESWLTAAAAVPGALCLPFRFAAAHVVSKDRSWQFDQIGMMLVFLSVGWIILAPLV
ncbi:hypothetical protein HG717_15965 [Rhodococcus erythropolis]|uniref:hypothetical protein n=1 Tax=Rhodococcus erythropolis TaxID=1833 RepID=UPI001C9A8879|nr:hypothetical protein [Rhodococcus erythropolis]MBY6385396.1 hypothetical protein [Rhodococcus erythropolis]